jgi:hypothetical protein
MGIDLGTTNSAVEAAKSADSTFIDESDLASTAVGLLSFADLGSVEVEPLHHAGRLNKARRARRIGSKADGGNGTEPFEALNLLKDRRRARSHVLLTAGVWDHPGRAVNAAQRCHLAGIQVVAIGFGGADQPFLQRIANSDEDAFLTEQDNLSAVFGEIAQGIVEVGVVGAGGATTSGLGWLRSR